MVSFSYNDIMMMSFSYNDIMTSFSYNNIMMTSFSYNDIIMTSFSYNNIMMTSFSYNDDVILGSRLRQIVRGRAAARCPLQASRELHAQGRQAPLPRLQRGILPGADGIERRFLFGGDALGK